MEANNMRRTTAIESTNELDQLDYLDLVKAFPLRPLRSKSEHEAAGKILDHFIGRDDLTEGQNDYLAALVLFVEEFEETRFNDWASNIDPLNLIKHLMEENDMSTSDLGDVLGSRGLASEVLCGKRGLSKALIRKLAVHFGVEPGLFLN
jgi:HTH-type transcriptional regulator / antitoxin HigA